MSDNLTPRQQAWFAAVKASLERDTGRTLEAWAQIVQRDCPESKPRARALWLKTQYGLGANRAAQILDAAFPAPAGWDLPQALREALWKDPAILVAFTRLIADLPEVTPTQRKGYSAFSRNVQFAALKPVRMGACLGLALPVAADPRLALARREGWSERLTATLILTSPEAVTADLLPLIEAAWARA